MRTRMVRIALALLAGPVAVSGCSEREVPSQHAVVPPPLHTPL